ncbi:glutathione S-transferase Mu 2 isoform X7 [Ochotona curzoniae]|uniref:glutathione S-transferase Mu 2 isoform X7 n=1 Tax=Ochotona curzoniae TaxID=130825 RepID=UPI001B352C67|nr:glutathione S-transferase Mu 2 isoform X7 [Ochotona curzoniae]
MTTTVGYWDIRGMCHAIRLLLEYTDTSYNEKTYSTGDAPDYDQSQWLSEKFKLGLDFPNEKQKPEYLKSLPDKLTVYSQFLGKRSWFAGDKITFADFLVYDILDQNCLFAPGCLDAFPNLKDFMARFEGLPKIAAYMKSSRFLRVPVFLKSAKWTGK